jgi:hypothetical protein
MTISGYIRRDWELTGGTRFKHAALAAPQNEICDGSVEDDADNEGSDNICVVQGLWKHIKDTRQAADDYPRCEHNR